MTHVILHFKVFKLSLISSPSKLSRDLANI